MSAQSISLDSVVVAAPGQISSQVKDETVVLDLERGEYHGLEGIGPRIWDLLQSPRSVNEIRDQILVEYEVSQSECEADLLEHLNDLKSRGLIEVRG